MHKVQPGDYITAVYKNLGKKYSPSGDSINLGSEVLSKDFTSIEDAMAFAADRAGNIQGAWWRDTGSNKGEEPIPGGWGKVFNLMHPGQRGWTGYSVHWYRKKEVQDVEIRGADSGQGEDQGRG